MSKKKIQDFDFIYALAKPIVGIAFRLFYNKITIEGIKNIPKDKTIILAPNHQNALMDALAVLRTQPGQPVFLARADIFEKKWMAWLLKGLNILPVYRMRDGRDELDKNNDIFEQAIDVLRDNVALCLMPEGEQNSTRTLLPLVKGMFRIALSAQEELSAREIVIIPVGLDYDDYVHPGKNMVIRFGAPIPINIYIPIYQAYPAKALNILRRNLYEKMSDLIQNIRSKTHYDVFYNLSLMTDSALCRHNGTNPKNPLSLLKARKKISEALDKKEIEEPEELDRLCFSYTDYIEKLRVVQLKDAVLEPFVFTKTLIQSILLAFTCPLFLAGYAANFIPSFISSHIANGIKSDNFKSSFHVVLWVLFFPVYYTLIIITLSLILHAFSWAALVALAAMIAGRFAFYYKKRIIEIRAQWRFFFKRKKYPKETKTIEQQRAYIVNTIVDWVK